MKNKTIWESEFFKQNWFKLGLLLTIILGFSVLGVSFYATQINKQNSIEKQKANESQAEKKEEQEKILNAQLAEQEKSGLLNECLLVAQKNYSTNWATACRTQAATISKNNEDCFKKADSPLDFPESVRQYITPEYIENFKEHCRQLYGAPDYSENCALADSSVAKRLDDFLKTEQEKCYSLYK